VQVRIIILQPLLCGYKIFNTLELGNYYQQMQSNGILLSYKGSVNHQLLECLMKLTEDKLLGVEGKRGLQKKVYTIVVEVLQNIYHHFDPSFVQQELDAIAFVIGHSDDGYVIMAGNYVDATGVEVLKQKIDEINGLSADELTQRYREALDCEGFTQKGGAGLGILYIARKSGEKLEYEVNQQLGTHPFFSLKVKVRA
jgi:hypothetical protein